jgi:hypothetical protein
MSDSLQGNIPELEDEDFKQFEEQFVIVVANRTTSGKQLPITGTLQTVLFDEKPEIEIKVQLKDALDVIEAGDQVFEFFDLHHGERIVKMMGPFTVKAARIQDLNPTSQMCVLALQLKRIVAGR